MLSSLLYNLFWRLHISILFRAGGLDFPMIILVTGSPGVGKSELAKVVSEDLRCKVVESSEVMVREKAVIKDPARDTFIIEWDQGLRVARSVASKSIDSCVVVVTVTPTLWLEAVESEIVFIVLARCNPLILFRRLERRGWRKGKIVENVMAEAFGVIAEELEPWWHSTFEVDTSDKNPRKVYEELLNKIDSWSVGINIDWLSLESVGELVARLSAQRDLDEYRLGM